MVIVADELALGNFLIVSSIALAAAHFPAHSPYVGAFISDPALGWLQSKEVFFFRFIMIIL
jgi:hypothetical protein